jgi:hypothetical protein
MENLTDCLRCGSNACLEQTYENNITGCICFGCGFTTSTEMIKNSELLDTILSSAPELYKDLMYVDNTGKVWMPSTVTLPNVGMVFVDGTNSEDWKWAGVLAVPISIEERNKFPENQTHKMDFKNVKHFSTNDYMDALEYIGFFKIGN